MQNQNLLGSSQTTKWPSPVPFASRWQRCTLGSIEQCEQPSSEALPIWCSEPWCRNSTLGLHTSGGGARTHCSSRLKHSLKGTMLVCAEVSSPWMPCCIYLINVSLQLKVLVITLKNLYLCTWSMVQVSGSYHHQYSQLE